MMPSQIIWLTGMPRSGTTWISQIFASHPDVRVKFCPLFSYAFKNALDENATSDEWYNFFSKVYHTADDYMDQEHLRSKSLIPTFVKDLEPSILLIKSNRFHHLTEKILEKCRSIKFISIVRHPCAAIHSWLSNPLEFPKGCDPLNEWRSGRCRKDGSGEFWGFDDWKTVTGMHMQMARIYPERFFLRRYESFLADPVNAAKEIFQRLGIPMAPSTEKFILSTQSRHDAHRRSIYKVPSEIEAWKKNLSAEIAATIYNELSDTAFSKFLEE